MGRRLLGFLLTCISIVSILSWWLWINSGSGSGQFLKNLGAGYVYHSEMRMILRNPRGDDDVFIPPVVEDFAVFSEFIVARQRDYKQSNRHYFWVLDTAKHKVYGPLEGDAVLKFVDHFDPKKMERILKRP